MPRSLYFKIDGCCGYSMLNLEVAQEMEITGKSVEDISALTNKERSKNNKCRCEIMTGVKRLKISTRSLHIRGRRGCVIWCKYHEIFDGVNFVNKKLKKVGVRDFLFGYNLLSLLHE